jgi:hypothetical protein
MQKTLTMIQKKQEILKANQKTIYREEVIGSRRFSNFFWASTLLMGSLGFFLVGISSLDVIPFFKTPDIVFFPQGLVMCFYGILGFLISSYLWLVILWDIGNGYNEFNKETGQMKVFRFGFPGKNRRIQVLASLNEIEAIRMDLRDGINPKATVYVKIKGNRDVPLTQIGQPLTFEEIETAASNLAIFLNVPLQR